MFKGSLPSSDLDVLHHKKWNLNSCLLVWLTQAKNVDVIAVLMHWGREYRPRMNNLQREVAQHLTSLGVQLVIGAHPHIQQPYSYFDSRFVDYSVGNLLFVHDYTPDKENVSITSKSEMCIPNYCGIQAVKEPLNSDFIIALNVPCILLRPNFKNEPDSVNPLTPKSDWELIPPYKITPE